MKKLILLISIAIFAICSVKAQQLPMFSQYMFNDYAINPAIAGTHDYYQVVTNYRYQWAGINDAPKTYMVSMYGPHKSQPMGWGGYIINDKTGPTIRTGAYGSYAYNLQLSGDLRISMGLSLGFVQYKFDLSGINVYDINDPIMIENGDQFTKFVPDASFGVYVYSSQYYGGISMNQLLSNKMTLSDSIKVDKTIAKLKNHIYLHGGYKYNINRDFDVEPTLMLKMMAGVPPQLDITARAIYQKMVWAGLSYRTGDAITILMGYNYNNMLYAGVSYDITVSQMSEYSNGTFEILIGVKFNKIKSSGSGGGGGRKRLN